MSNDTRRKSLSRADAPAESGAGAPAVEIDPRLVMEALAAVSEPARPRTGRPVPANLRGMPVASAPARPAARPAPPPVARTTTTTPAPDPDELPTVEKFTGDAAQAEAQTDLAPAPEPRPEPAPEPRREAGSEAQGRSMDFFQLRLELERTRGERDDLRGRLETESRERLKMVARLKRATDDVERLNTALATSEEARANAENTASLARDAARSAQEGIERVRERGRRAEEEYRKASALPLLAELLPTLENLERALHTGRHHPEQLSTGLEIVVSQFHAALSRVGVERVDATPGTLFQPAVHEAVLYVAVHDAAPGSIVSEMQPGYTWQGKLIRASRVSVAAPPDQAQLSLDQVEQRRARSALSEGETLSLPSDDASQDPVSVSPDEHDPFETDD